MIGKYFFKKNKKAKYVDIGYMITDKKTLIRNFPDKNISFSYFIDSLVKQNKAYCYINDTGYLSISDLKRYNN